MRKSKHGIKRIALQDFAGVIWGSSHEPNHLGLHEKSAGFLKDFMR